VDKIFDPFFTTKEVGKGTGLGLATVLAIVKSHGGFVTLRTGEGAGTTFFVHLPAAPVAGEATENGEDVVSKRPRGHGEVLLVVDDEENIRDIIRGALVRHDYKVITAGDGAEGLARYLEASKDVAAVITDLDMPVMDGLAMIQVLRRMNPSVRVLVSTGVASQTQMKNRGAELASLGITQTLIKPYSAEKILEAVHQLLAAPARSP
jgi:CheY-like chemotaxis protein